MDNCIAVDSLLASHGAVCVIAYTSCCTWINETGKVEQAMYHLKEKAHDSHVLLDLFSWPRWSS